MAVLCGNRPVLTRLAIKDSRGAGGALARCSYLHYRYYAAGATYGAVEGLAKGTYSLFKVKFSLAFSMMREYPWASAVE